MTYGSPTDESPKKASRKSTAANFIQNNDDPDLTNLNLSKI
jgi:hypothetical protein